MPFQTKTAAEKTASPPPRLDDLGELLTRHDVMALLRLGSDRTLRTLIADGSFPRPIEFNSRLFRWSKSAVASWLARHGGDVAEPRDEGHSDWEFAAGG